MARRIVSDIETACGEVAMEAVEGPNFGELDIPVCGDPQGALADNLYNDVDFFSDMLADRIYDAGRTWVERKAIIDAMLNGAHTALKVAIEKFIEGRKEIFADPRKADYEEAKSSLERRNETIRSYEEKGSLSEAERQYLDRVKDSRNDLLKRIAEYEGKENEEERS